MRHFYVVFASMLQVELQVRASASFLGTSRFASLCTLVRASASSLGTSRTTLVHASASFLGTSRTNDNAPLRLCFTGALSGKQIMVDEEAKSPIPLEIEIDRSATVYELREAVSRKKSPPYGTFWDFVVKGSAVQFEHTSSTCFQVQKVLARLWGCLCNRRRSGGSLHEALLPIDPPVKDLERGPPKTQDVGFPLRDDFRTEFCGIVSPLTLEFYGIETDTALQVYANPDGESIRASEAARQRGHELFEMQKECGSCLCRTAAGGLGCMFFVLTLLFNQILFNQLYLDSSSTFWTDCVFKREHYYNKLRGINSASSDVAISYHATPFNETPEFSARAEQISAACGACGTKYSEAMKREAAVGCCLPGFDVFHDQLGKDRPFSEGEWESATFSRRRRSFNKGYYREGSNGTDRLRSRNLLREDRPQPASGKVWVLIGNHNFELDIGSLVGGQTIWKPNPVDPQHPHGVDFDSTEEEYRQQLKDAGVKVIGINETVLAKNDTHSCVDCLRTKEALAEEKWGCLLRAGLRLPTPARDHNFYCPQLSSVKPRNRELEALLKLGGNESRWCSVAERTRRLDEEEIDNTKTCSQFVIGTVIPWSLFVDAVIFAILLFFSQDPSTVFGCIFTVFCECGLS